MARIKVTIVGLFNFQQDLFDQLQLPSDLDPALFKDTLLEQAGDLPLLYPNGDFMKHMIGVWSANELQIWQDLYETTQYEYNPIDNYDRHETITRTTTGSGSSTTIDKATAFNEIQPRETGRSEATGNNSGSESVTAHLRGNIGVTTTQQMIEAQREIVDFNVINFIVRSFINRFCIEIY